MKASAVIRIVIWIVVAVILLSILLVGITGGIGRWFRWDWANNIFGGGYSYENADRYTAAGSGIVSQAVVDRIDVNWMSGSVEFTVYDGDDIEFEEHSSSGIEPDYQMRYYVEGGTLYIRFARANAGFLGFGLFRNLSKTLTIRIPQNKNFEQVSVDTVSADVGIAGVDAGEMEADTISGRVDISGGAARDVDVGTVSGRVTLGDLAVTGGVGVDTTSGAIEIDRVAADEIDCDSVSGKVELSDCSMDEFNGNTTSGAVTLDSRSMPKSIKIGTISGSMKVYIPENDGFETSYDKVSGSFHCDFEVSETKNTATYKNGGSTIDFNTVSGSMSIYRR